MENTIEHTESKNNRQPKPPVQLVLGPDAVRAIGQRSVEEELTVFAGKAIIVTLALSLFTIAGALATKIAGPASV